MIKHFIDKILKATFHSLSQIEAYYTKAISHKFKSKFIRDDQNLERLIGISVDGANEIIDKHRSLATV